MHNRKQYLIDRALQYRLGVELMVIVLLMLAVPFVFFASFLVGGKSVPGLGSEGLIAGLIRYHWPSLALFYLAYFGIVYVFVVYYSHRIAGPVHRIRRVLDETAAGCVGHQVHLRRGDYFDNLGASLNRATGILMSDLAELKTAATALSEKAVSGARDLGAPLEKIQSILDRYRVAPEN